jgi:type II secretory pathway component PulF
MSAMLIVAIFLLCLYGVLGYVKPAIAVVTAPFAAGTLTVVAMGQESLVLLFTAPLLIVVSMSAVIVATHGAESESWRHRWAARLLIAVVGLAFIMTAFTVIAAGVGAFLVVLFLIGLVVIFVALVAFSFVSRRAAVMNVFSTIGSSMRQNLPLPMALDCAAAGRGDVTAFLLQRIKTWLVKGYALSEAIQRGYPQCPPRALSMIAAGERVGQLPAAVRAIEMDMKARSTERLRLRPVHPAYPVIVLIIVFFLVTGLMTYVIPQFKAVLEEMTSGQLPAATRILLGIMQTLLYEINPAVYLGVIILIFVWPWVHRSLRRRRPGRLRLYAWAIDLFRWHMPIVHWFEKNQSMVQVVELLRMSLQAGCPVNEAIRGTLQLDVNLVFRARLARWLRRVERGEDIGAAARRCGLGSALGWAFDSSAETPAVLEMLESHYRSNYSYGVNLARFILWPLGIILLGATVGFVVFAFFSPLVATISELSTTVYP